MAGNNPYYANRQAANTYSRNPGSFNNQSASRVTEYNPGQGQSYAYPQASTAYERDGFRGSSIHEYGDISRPGVQHNDMGAHFNANRTDVYRPVAAGRTGITSYDPSSAPSVSEFNPYGSSSKITEYNPNSQTRESTQERGSRYIGNYDSSLRQGTEYVSSNEQPKTEEKGAYEKPDIPFYVPLADTYRERKKLECEKKESITSSTPSKVETADVLSAVLQHQKQETDPNYDPTLENILKSIGFDFELSRKTQEKAKKEREALETFKKSKTEPHEFGIKETDTSTFLGSNISSVNIKDIFQDDKNHSSKDHARMTADSREDNVPETAVERRSHTKVDEMTAEDSSKAVNENEDAGKRSAKLLGESDGYDQSRDFSRHSHLYGDVQNEPTSYNNNARGRYGDNSSRPGRLNDTSANGRIGHNRENHSNRFRSPDYDSSFPRGNRHYLDRDLYTSRRDVELSSSMTGVPNDNIRRSKPSDQNYNRESNLRGPEEFGEVHDSWEDEDLRPKLEHGTNRHKSMSDHDSNRRSTERNENVTRYHGFRDRNNTFDDRGNHRMLWNEEKRSSPKRGRSENDTSDEPCAKIRRADEVQTSVKLEENEAKEPLESKPTSNEGKVENMEDTSMNTESPLKKLTEEDLEKFYNERDEKRCRLSAMESQLGQLRRNEEDLIRKGVPEDDDLLVQSFNLKEEIRKAISELKDTIESNTSKIKTALEKEAAKMTKRPKLKVVGKYSDEGNYWCPNCHMNLGSFSELFHHLNTSDHLKLFTDARRKIDQKISEEVFEGIEVEGGAVQGTEFLFRVDGYFCDICKVYIHGRSAAEKHLLCNAHNQEVKEFHRIFPSYDRLKKLDRELKLEQTKREEKNREGRHEEDRDRRRDDSSSRTRSSRDVNDQDRDRQRHESKYGRGKISISMGSDRLHDGHHIHPLHPFKDISRQRSREYDRSRYNRSPDYRYRDSRDNSSRDSYRSYQDRRYDDDRAYRSGHSATPRSTTDRLHTKADISSNSSSTISKSAPERNYSNHTRRTDTQPVTLSEVDSSKKTSFTDSVTSSTDNKSVDPTPSVQTSKPLKQGLLPIAMLKGGPRAQISQRNRDWSDKAEPKSGAEGISRPIKPGSLPATAIVTRKLPADPQLDMFDDSEPSKVTSSKKL